MIFSNIISATINIAASVIAFSFVAYLILIALHVIILTIAWTRSYFLEICPSIENLQFDLRADPSNKGTVIEVCAMKAQPRDSAWFGHMWIVWPEAPPKAKDGAKAAGFYASCKTKAAKYIVSSIFYPIWILTGKKPISGGFLDDKYTKRDWHIKLIVDDDAYQRALEVDTIWRDESRYLLLPRIGGRTYSCRDYVFEVVSALGLKRTPKNWAVFPPESFLKLLTMNGLQIKKNWRPRPIQLPKLEHGFSLVNFDEVNPLQGN
jgi:hypothetical protein